MGRKTLNGPRVLMAAGDMSGDLTSDEQPTHQFDVVNLQLVWTGNPVGNFIIEGRVGSTWSNLDPRDADGNPPTAAGVAGNHMITLNLVPQAVRVSYDAISGAGTLSIDVMSKGMGA